MKDRMWVIALNDGEAAEILELLREHGEAVLVSRQPWGASWANLEPELLSALQRFRHDSPHGQILGVELTGPAPLGASNVDHHKYADDDRSNPLCSLEQIAQKLGASMSRRQLLAAANDRGYIPAMLLLGASPQEVEEVRAADRYWQGLRAADEQQAEEDLKNAEWKERKVLVRCTHKGTACHTDRLYGKADDILLAAPSQWNYYGPRYKEFARLGMIENHWSGGTSTTGYFGVEMPSPTTRQRMLDVFWNPHGSERS